MEHTTLVLGSTQRAEIVRRPQSAESGPEVVRRRGGGGAVLLRPGDHLWIDAWIPRDDPLWNADVATAAAWVGEWWRAALGAFGLSGCVVHHGRAVPGRHGSLVCFAGRGPGELFWNERKVMGVSQWRSREGSLFQCCAYSRWDPRALVEVLEEEPSLERPLQRDLSRAAVGVADLIPPGPDLAALAQALLSSFPTWERATPIRSA